MNIKQNILNIIKTKHLTNIEMYETIIKILKNKITNTQIGGFLIGLRIKKETINEIIISVKAIRALSNKISIKTINSIDTCGTGGDNSKIFNVSTASTFIVNIAGATVAKHGNKSITSFSGSVDILNIIGVNIQLIKKKIKRSIDEIGIGFMFAIQYNKNMKYISKARKELGTKTIFNILGPLVNPANSKYQIIGVFNKSLNLILAKALQKIETNNTLILHSQDGLDEISIASQTYISEIKNNKIINYIITPEQFGMKKHSLKYIRVNSVYESIDIIKSAIDLNNDISSQMIALNAGTAIYMAEITQTLKEGIKLAQNIIKSKKVNERIQELIDFTQMAN